MDRLVDIDQARVAYWRELHHNSSAAEDTELDPLDRRDRADVIVGSNLKRDDDVLIAGSIPARIVGPGSGRNVAYCYSSWFVSEYGDEPLGIQLFRGDVTDRAPADTSEDPPLPAWSTEAP